jgi:hypothetical protein
MLKPTAHVVTAELYRITCLLALITEFPGDDKFIYTVDIKTMALNVRPFPRNRIFLRNRHSLKRSRNSSKEGMTNAYEILQNLTVEY